MIFTSHTIDRTGGRAYGGHIEIFDLPGVPSSDLEHEYRYQMGMDNL